MLAHSLVAFALLAAPEVELRAGLSTTASGGYTPVVAGGANSTAFSTEIMPQLAMQLADAAYTLSVGYNLRIFYRGFFGNTDIEPLDRPLFLHGATVGYGYRLSKSWRLGVDFQADVGEVDFQSTARTDPDEVTVGADAGRQTANSQAINAGTFTGNFSIGGQVSRRMTWSNVFGASYTTPLGELDSSGPDAAFSQVPENLTLSYGTSLAYTITREHNISGTTTYAANIFNADTTIEDEAGNPVRTERSQLFHSVAVAIGYGWNFARNSNLDVAVGAQLAIGQATFTDDQGVSEDASTDLIPLPNASVGLTWLPVNRRSISVSNNLSVGVAGSVDPLFGTFQPRLSSSLSFTLGFPPRLSVGVLGSLSTPLRAPEQGQGVQFGAGFGVGDSQLELSIPITYQFNEWFSASIGGRLTRFFTRFGIPPAPAGLSPVDPADPDPDIPVEPVGASTFYEGFLTLSFGVSSRRSGGRTTGGGSSGNIGGAASGVESGGGG